MSACDVLYNTFAWSKHTITRRTRLQRPVRRCRRGDQGLGCGDEGHACWWQATSYYPSSHGVSVSGRVFKCIINVYTPSNAGCFEAFLAWTHSFGWAAGAAFVANIAFLYLAVTLLTNKTTILVSSTSSSTRRVHYMNKLLFCLHKQILSIPHYFQVWLNGSERRHSSQRCFGVRDGAFQQT